MADRAFQVSGKLSDGRIFVVGADTYIDLANNLTDALGQDAASTVLKDFTQALATSNAAIAQQVRAFAPAAPAPMTPVEVAASFGGNVVGETASGPVCKHGEPARLVPAGVSKSTGKPYRAFYTCARPRETQCDFRANG